MQGVELQAQAEWSRVSTWWYLSMATLTNPQTSPGLAGCGGAGWVP